MSNKNNSQISLMIKQALQELDTNPFAEPDEEPKANPTVDTGGKKPVNSVPNPIVQKKEPTVQSTPTQQPVAPKPQAHQVVQQINAQSPTEPKPQVQKPVVDPEIEKMQNDIYSMKKRMGKLQFRVYMKNFLNSLKDYELHVTRFLDDKTKVAQYLAPLKANAEALSGILQSIVSESESLEKVIGEGVVNTGMKLNEEEVELSGLERRISIGSQTYSGHQLRSVLTHMIDWNRETLGKSGLLKNVERFLNLIINDFNDDDYYLTYD